MNNDDDKSVYRTLTLRLNRRRYKPLKMLATTQERPIQAILTEILDAYLLSDALESFSRGGMTTREVVDATGLRDYAQVLIALGDAGLPMPTLPEAEIERQASVFAELVGQREPPEADARVTEIERLALEVFGTKERAAKWMQTPNFCLGQRMPESSLDTEESAESVRQILNAIRYGGVV
jgi:putative toxin-antitoxin system antitoxin component (TIGR02293 family)